MDCMIAPAIAEQAIAWLIALQTPPVSPQTLDAWRCWRASDPQHERAWQRLAAFSAYPDDELPEAMRAPPSMPIPDNGPLLQRRQVVMSLAAVVAVGSLAGWGRKRFRGRHKGPRIS